MNGTEKQISWANSIIKIKELEVNKIIEEKKKLLDFHILKKTNRIESLNKTIEELESIKGHIKNISNEAKWYIAFRGYPIQLLIEDIKENKIKNLEYLYKV